MWMGLQCLFQPLYHSLGVYASLALSRALNYLC